LKNLDLVIAEVAVGGHLEEIAETGAAVDSEETAETIEEMTGEEAVAELATIAIGLDTWQEIARIQTVGMAAEEEVDLAAEEAEVEHAITAIEKDNMARDCPEGDRRDSRDRGGR